MKLTKSLRLPATAGLVLFALSGWAVGQTAEEHASHHPEQAQAQQPAQVKPAPGAAPQQGMGPGMMGGGMMGQGMMQGDMAEMCEMHMAMMQAGSPEERRARMAEHIKQMPPEMLKQRMEMMNKQMNMMREQMDMMRQNMSASGG